MVVIEAKKGAKLEGSDVGFWGQVGPNDDDDDLPLAWLADYAAEPAALTDIEDTEA